MGKTFLEEEESKKYEKDNYRRDDRNFVCICGENSVVFKQQNIMGNETSQEENCEQLSWTLKNGILIISGQGKIPTDFFEDNLIDPDQPKELINRKRNNKKLNQVHFVGVIL